MISRSALMRLATVALLACLVLAACGTPAVQPPPEEKAPPRVAMVLPGSIGVEGYNAAGHVGILAIKESYGAETALSDLERI